MRMFMGILCISIFFTCGVLFLVQVTKLVDVKNYCYLFSGFYLICTSVALTIFISRENRKIE